MTTPPNDPTGTSPVGGGSSTPMPPPAPGTQVPSAAPAYGQPTPAEGYGPATQTATASPVVAGDGPKGGGKRTAIVAGAVVAALAVGGGAYALTSKLKSSGEQPDVVVPADAWFYGRIDMDPAAGQKVSTVRFFDKFGSARDGIKKDPREWLFDQAKKDSSCLSGKSYDEVFGSWLGDRAALAVRPGMAKDNNGKDMPNVEVVVAVKDEAKAREGLDKIANDCGGKKITENADLNFAKGYLILTPKGKGQETMDALGKGSLATNSTYTGDMAALGDPGVASMWADGKAAADGLKDYTNSAQDSDQAKAALDQMRRSGRSASALRFDASYVEVAGVVRGSEQLKDLPQPNDPSDLVTMPGDTVAAVHVSNAGEIIKRNWDSIKNLLEKQGTKIGDIETQLGVKLPDDLVTLLGKQLTLDVPKQDFTSIDDDNLPKGGLKISGDDGQKAKDILKKMVESSGGNLDQVKTKVDGGSFYLAMRDDSLDSLSAKGNLGDNDAFKQAIPNADKAQYALFVNLDELENLYIDKVPNDSREAVQNLRAIGLSGGMTGSDEAQWSFRVVSN